MVQVSDYSIRNEVVRTYNLPNYIRESKELSGRQ